jgi:hypothetical protein
MKTQYIYREHGFTCYYSDRDMTLYHREDGPAVICSDGYEAWYINDELHNPNGPAVTYPDGSKQWYINGEEMTETQFNEITNQPNQPKQ